MYFSYKINLDFEIIMDIGGDMNHEKNMDFIFVPGCIVSILPLGND